MKLAAAIVAFVTMLGVGVFASASKRYLRWLIVALAIPMVRWPELSVMLISEEGYRGSTRGMEVSLPYLLAFAVLVALSIRRRAGKLFVDGGSAFFFLYWFLSLPSLVNCENLTYAWFEIWKVPMMFLVYRAVRGYCRFTDDYDAPLVGLGIATIGNFLEVLKQHFIIHVAQAKGVFVHQNSMATWAMLAAAVFFAAYLNLDRSRYRKFYAVSFVCAAAASLRAYSRGAMMCLALACAIVAAVSFVRNFKSRLLMRVVPLAVLAALGLALALPKIVNRFEVASTRSGRMRVVFAQAAMRMVADHPLAGVGLNNWGIKINPPYAYSKHREEFGMNEDFKDGIVETIYLLTWAECGTFCFLALLGLFLWHWLKALRLVRLLKGEYEFFIPAGLLGGLTGLYLQSALEWVLKQSINFCELAICFGLIAALNEKYSKKNLKKLAAAKRAADKKASGDAVPKLEEKTDET